MPNSFNLVPLQAILLFVFIKTKIQSKTGDKYNYHDSLEAHLKKGIGY